MAAWQFGAFRLLMILFGFFPALVLLLYLQGLKLSLLGTQNHNLRLALTQFGPPVDGLSSGMLLVSIRAGGPFLKTVLYVIEHRERGSLALILNTTMEGAELALDGDLSVSHRSGGPVHLPGFFCIHDVGGVPGADRLLRNGEVFLNRNVPLQTLKSSCAKEHRIGHAMLVQGVSSWGERQLEGEVRRGAWGWIRPEYVRSEDILEMDPTKLGGLWNRLVQSPHLEVFEG